MEMAPPTTHFCCACVVLRNTSRGQHDGVTNSAFVLSGPVYLLLISSTVTVHAPGDLNGSFTVQSATSRTHLAAKCHPKLDGHMSQATQPHNTDLVARLVQAVVLVGCVGGDASTDQGSNTSQVQVCWDGVYVAAGTTGDETEAQRELG